MRFLNSQQKDIDGFLLNFAQQEPFVDNNFIGLIEDSNPLRGDHIEFKYYAGDAKQRDQADQVQVLKPKEYNVVSYPAGRISPHPVTMVFPDRQGQLPNPVRTITAENAPKGSTEWNMGAVLSQLFYQPKSILEGLYGVAEQQPEVLKQMQEVTMQSRLDEVKQERVVKSIDEVLGAVNRNKSSNNS